MSRAGGRSSKGKGKERAVVELDDSDDYSWEEQEIGKNGGCQATEEEQDKLEQLESELSSLDNQILKLQKLRSSVRNEYDTFKATLISRSTTSKSNAVPSTSAAQPAPSKAVVNFEKSNYEWSKEAKSLAKDIWDIDSYRHCQESAINASMAGRDAVVVMPTGGGKSLIYQIPALLSPGSTVVITPLISLMSDQVHNLHSRNIAAEAIHAATSQQESKSILKRMLGSAGTTKKGKKKVEEEEEEQEEIKLIYVTPERIDKSKTFVSTLQKMYDSGLISRFVIDEAHCITLSGHDYRPAYLSLQRLKVLFPKVPILAVTATAPSNVIQDMIKTLGLPKKTSPGHAALPGSTILFTAPLYRPNLNWSVVPKPQKAEQANQAIISYILEHHEGETGIIYTLSRADSENIAKEINANPKCKGKLKAAVYHAYIDDAEKLKVHDLWREKKIQVVCATNASFGLGIDNPSVRYVVHHTLAKSLANFYQEGGRAGRDGLPSDCITFFRAADASRLSTLIYETWFSGGKEKLYEMLKFAQDFRTCRKVLFARYFASTHDNSQAFDEDESEEPCGSCDNCTRDPETVTTVDITLQAYRALRIIEAASAQDGTLTLPQAGDLVRGNGGGSFSTKTGKNNKAKGVVNVKEVAGGKVTLNKDETESMLLKLLVDGYLKENFANTAYSTNSYIGPEREKPLRLTRFSPAEVEASGLPFTLTMDVLSTGGGGKGKKRKSTESTKEPAKKKVKANDNDKKVTQRRRISPDDENEEEDYPVYGEEEEEDQNSAFSGDAPSSDPVVDEDGWSQIVKNESSSNGKKKKKEPEVIELD